MTPEAQRIAIAEACGFRKYERPNILLWYHPEKIAVRYCELPDYLADLNAKHEAEKTLSEGQQWQQACFIVNYHVAPSGFPIFSRSEVILLACATAAQRAEAFLKTLGKWEDDK